MSAAHIISINDSPQLVYVGELSKAEERLDELARKHYEAAPCNYGSYEAYRGIIFWHIRIVAMEVEV